MNKNPVPEDFAKTFLTCPLTGKLFNNPIIDKKGNIYEQQAYFAKNKDDIGVCYVVVSLKSFITTFLDTYPEFGKRQYVIKEEDKKNHLLYAKKVQNIIDEKKFTELKNYTSFSLNCISGDTIKRLLGCEDISVKRYFIDNVIDLSVSVGNGNWYFINYLCCSPHKNEETLKYLLGKGNYMKLYCKDDGWYPLHQLLANYSIGMESIVIYAINKHISEGVDLFVPESEGRSIPEIIFGKNEVLINHILSVIDHNSASFKNLIPKLLDKIDSNSRINNDAREKIKCVLLHNI